MGGTYGFAKAASANLREKDDSWNTTVGGFLAGSIMGLRCEISPLFSDWVHAQGTTVRTLPAVLGYGAGLAVVMGAFDYTGGALTGFGRDPDVDEYEQKEFLRRNRRRPIQETIEDLGEGRGEDPSLAPCIWAIDKMYVLLTRPHRCIRARIPRTETGENQTELRDRCTRTRSHAMKTPSTWDQCKE